jgi:membrane-bound lytic murein transglycosylase D
VATGQRLIIPRAPALLAARTDNPAPDTESRQVDPVLSSNAAPKADEPAQASLVYRVKRGDTLFSIARLYRTTVASLKTWNRLRSNSIQVGQRLTIFTQRTATATN